MEASTKTDIALEPSNDRVAMEMYERNCYAEEYLGVILNFNNANNGAWANKETFNDVIRNDVKNEKKFDVIHCQIPSSMMTCIEEGLVVDLNTVEAFNFDAPWWIAGIVDNFSINGKLYSAMGDISLSTYTGMQVIWFNSVMSEAYSLENPYTSVANNTWTLDKLFTNAKAVEETVDGEYDPLKNKMGLLSLHTANRTWIAALDLHLVNRNSETGIVSVPTNPSEKLIDVFNKMYDVFENENEFYVHTKYLENSAAFNQGTVLYLCTALSHVSHFRDMEDDYGMVPMPKYNSAQEKFYTVTGNIAWMLPSTAPAADNELSAKVMEVLGYYGRENVVPEYYETTLGLKLARDEKVQEMLTLLRDGAVVRWEYVYDRVFKPSIWNCLQMNDAFRHPVEGKETTYHGDNIVNWWAANQQTWATAVANLYAKLS